MDLALAETDAIAMLPQTEQPRKGRSFIDSLFERSQEWLENGRFASIGEADEFFTKVVGVTFENRQDLAGGMQAGDALELRHDPLNPYDTNAVEVRFGSLKLGYIRKQIAARIAPNIIRGDLYSACVASVSGGQNDKAFGINIAVKRRLAHGSSTTNTLAASDLRAGYHPDAVRQALLGDRKLRDAQMNVLARINEGENTLAVFGTGRGKSVCFQIPAAERALKDHKKTLILYPLRALANDQFEAMTRNLSGLGLRILRANGSIDDSERFSLNQALEDGSWDILLATPEFATFHAAKFLKPFNTPDLIVIDEAHHLHESKHRPAYRTLGDLIERLGEPQVVALTATANAEAFQTIQKVLNIEAWVIDPTVRENLQIVDKRNVKDKKSYLTTLVKESTGKMIIYCNSRKEATTLATALRGAAQSPALGESESQIADGTLVGDIAFYHAGVPTEDRRTIETMFRAGEIRIVVATSAFGEGIDLPDVRNVVLYHLNFDLVEFNQMGGRAGRDGEPADIHLLFGRDDRRINDYILNKSAPTREMLRDIFRGIVNIGKHSDGYIRMTYEAISEALALKQTDGGTIGAAVRIFEELDLLQIASDDEGRFLRLLPRPPQIDIERSTRYAEGVGEREAFERFCGVALEYDDATLRVLMNRPIYPEDVPLMQ